MPSTSSPDTTFVTTAGPWDADGRCRSMVDGLQWRIDGAIPGERVRVRPTGRSRGAAVGWGRVETILGPAPGGPARRAPPCPHHTACGACGLQHADDDGRFDALVRSAAQRLPPALVETLVPARDYLLAPDPLGYRHKTILLPGNGDELTLGGFARGTHEVVDLPECRVLAPPLRRAEAALRAFLGPLFSRGGLAARPPGRGPTRAPGLRAVVLRGTLEGGVLATFVATDRKARKVLRSGAAGLVKAGDLAGAWLQEHSGQGDAVLGRRAPRLLAGARTVTERVGPLAFPLGPLSFFQVHPAMVGRMVPTLREALRGSKVVIDAYCGVGVLGLSAAPEGATVHGVEVTVEAIETARQVAANAGRKAAFGVGTPSTWTERPARCDALVLDPPRSGCRLPDLEALLETTPSTVVYVACSTDALARDAGELLRRGFRAERLVPAEMLPQTPHVEWIAVFRR